MKIFRLFLIFLLLLFSCIRQDDIEEYPVLGMDTVEDIILIEDHSEALLKWAQEGLRDAVVVHVDAHDDLGYIPDDKIDKIRSLIKAKRWKELEKSRDIGNRSLFKLNNFLYAAVKLRIVKEIYWVLPYRFFDDIPLAEEKVKVFLKNTGSKFPEDDINMMRMKAGCLTGMLSGVNISICSPFTLPKIIEPVILDIDIDFFPILAFESQQSKLRALKIFLDFMNYKELRIKYANIAYSVNDGYTRPIHRYIGDEIFEIIRNPQILHADSPPELWTFRDTAENMLSGGEDKLVVEYLEEPLKKYPDDLPLRILNASAKLFMKKFDEAFDEVDELCIKDVKYCYAFIYMADILSDNKEYGEAERFYERAMEALPENIDAIREYALFLHERDRYRDALRYAERLAEIADDMYVELLIGDCYFNLGEKGRSLKAYEKGISMYHERIGFSFTDQNIGYLKNLLKLYEESGQGEKAEQIRNKFNLL